MNYLAPATVEEAAKMLAEQPAAKVFAGATDVIPQIRAGRPEPETLIDLKGIARLTSVSHAGGTWTIGAATPTVDLTENAELAAQLPGFVEAAGLIGSDQIQNRCSLGGNLCNASPAADSVPAMIVNGARAVIASGGGTRTVPVADIATGPGSTSLAEGEFVVEIEIDSPPPNTGDAYLRMIPRTEMDIAVVGAGARITRDHQARQRRICRPEGFDGLRHRPTGLSGAQHQRAATVGRVWWRWEVHGGVVQRQRALDRHVVQVAQQGA